MDKPSVYIETSVISYLAADASRHPVTLRNQQLTHAWWADHRERYELWTSKLVIDEAADGDPRVAQGRLELLRECRLLEVDAGISELSGFLMRGVGLPPGAATDALHIAAAAVRGMTYLLTWNCRHIANPVLQARLTRLCARRGYVLPSLTTPRSLMGG